MNFLFHDYHQKTKTFPAHTENNLLNDNGVEIIKVYERFPVISLTKEGGHPLNLQTIKGFTLKQLSEVCNFSNAKITTNNQELSSFEIYIFLADGKKDLNAGLFHYRKDTHTLEAFYGIDSQECLRNLSKNCTVLNNEKIFLIFITSIFERNVKNFGELGYRLSLLETGSVVQTIKNNCVDLNLKSLLLESNDEHAFEEVLGIDGVTESLTAIISIF